MSNNLKSRFTSSTLTKILVAVLFTASAFTGHAQSISKTVTGNTDVTISYKGMEDNLMLLLVQFENPKGDKYLVRIQDKDKNNYYKEAYSGVVYSKLFKVPADQGNMTLTFENTSSKAKTAFVTNSIMRTYTDVAIKEIK
jgi:hypothetical protein